MDYHTRLLTINVEMFQSILFERVFQMRQERCDKITPATEIADLIYRSRNQDTPGAGTEESLIGSNSTGGVSLLDLVNCVEDRRH
jgi:hypothetical protein